MRIEIENYEALKNINIEIPVGLTQLSGKTNQGKSSLVRAIEDFYCSGAGKEEITVDESSMKIKVDDDYFTRNHKTKEYFINGVSYKNIGRSKFPELALLRLGPVNFQHQQEARFLIGDTPGAKYNYIVGERDDKFLSALNNMKKDSREMTTTNKVLIAQYTENENQINKINESLAAFDYEKAILLKKQILFFNEKIEKINSILEIKEELDRAMDKVTEVENRIMKKENFEKISQKIKELELLDKNTELEELNKKEANIKILTKKDLTKLDALLLLIKLKDQEKLIEDKKTLSESFIEEMRNTFNKLLLLNSASKLDSLKNAITQCNTVDYEMLYNEFIFINSKMEKVELITKYRKEYDINAGLLSIKEAEVERSEKELEKLKEELGACPLCGNSFKHEH